MKLSIAQIEQLHEDLTKPHLTVKMSASTVVRLIDTVSCDCYACTDILKLGKELLNSIEDTSENECLRVFLNRAIAAASARLESEKANKKYIEVFAHRILS